ncbi:putative OTU-like cysteine protease [Lyophyllum shimeji]|uniref:OTU-like cysteine protease n=1 Tax=Lyophyllum shimeji TaxID=47721 RepID=A0A9P3PGD9_LYOSH|nr:putative OTU-like cysteine protease [Lyophyllum shimeji]
MAGSKKNKAKKAESTSQEPPTPAVDDELMDELFAHLDSRDQTVQAESAAVINEVQTNEVARNEARSRKDVKSRFKARQARKAAAREQTFSPSDPETEARLKKEADDEEKDIDKVCQEKSLQIYEVNPDGHCLYSAVADQLALLDILPASQANYAVVRRAASQYMFSHPDDFVPFLAPPVDSDSGVMTPGGFERYCAAIRDTAEWGGEPEILALSRAYKVPIHVIQAGRPSVVVHDPGDPAAAKDEKRVVRISYHRRMYGLGEHYNSLRPKNAFSQLSQKMHTMLST